MRVIFGRNDNSTISVHEPGTTIRADVIIREIPPDYFSNGMYNADSLINGSRVDYLSDFKNAVQTFNLPLRQDVAIITGAYSYNAKEMIHVVTPTYHTEYDILEYYDVLESLYEDIFEMALEHQLEKVAMFIFGLGAWGIGDDYTAIQLAKYMASKYCHYFKKLDFFCNTLEQFKTASHY